MSEHPESFPVNTLVPIEGTPLENNDVSYEDQTIRLALMSQPVSVQTVLRTIATARIVLPKAIIRLAAGRHTFNETEQAMVSRHCLTTTTQADQVGIHGWSKRYFHW